MQTENPNCIKCLGGYVMLVDHMGDDAAIATAARVSYSGENTKSTSNDAQLIDYLVRHRHTSPLEMVEFKFQAKMPIFIARQWIRHRTASVNEMSGRYSEIPDEYWLPADDEWRGQDTHNKQGSTGNITYSPILFEDEMQGAPVEDRCFQEYHSRLDAGVSRELARICLPLSTYTAWVWKMDLHNLLHFLRLRLDAHAQPEIRVYAEAMLKLIEPIVPAAVSSWKNHVLNAVTFSEDELQVIKGLVKEMWDDPDGFASTHLSPSRAREFTEKLKRITPNG